MRRQAKIAATLGPASDDTVTLDAMLGAGAEVFRINFSHGTHEGHRRRVRRLRRAARRRGMHAALMADLQGPRFRVGLLEGGALALEEGERVDLVAGKQRSAAGTVPVSYAALARDVKRGQAILLDDGKLELRVQRVRGNIVRTEVVRGGVLTDRKGINLPGTDLSAPAVTAKDRKDLALAVELEADWLAVSFVRRAADVRLARRAMKRLGADLPVLAKIERPEALDRLDSILDASDGLLVARGDLGVELPPERVPPIQKEIIALGNREGKPVMTATQMLESMRHERRPTRAEASDVANAVLDGSGSLLLTAETAVGSYPVDAVRMMARIIEQAESVAEGVPWELPPHPQPSVSTTTCLAACTAACEIEARYLVVFTQSGFSARQVARFRPTMPILAFTPDPAVCRQLALYWGVHPRRLSATRSVESMMNSMDRALVKERLVRKGEIVVVVSGSPLGVPGTTNLVKVHRVGS